MPESEHTISTPPDSPYHHHHSKHKSHMTPGSENTAGKPNAIPFPLDTPANGEGSMSQSIGHYHDDDEEDEDDLGEQLEEINESLKELTKRQKDLCDYVMESSHHVHIQKMEGWVFHFVDDSKHALRWIRYVFAYLKWFYNLLGVIPLLGPYLQIAFIANIFCTFYVYTPSIVQEMVVTPLLRFIWIGSLMIFYPLVTCLYNFAMSTNMLGVSNLIKGFLIDTIGDAYTMFSKGMLGAAESPYFKEFIAVAAEDLDVAKNFMYDNVQVGMGSMWEHAGNLKAYFNP
jgi:hypothetical protein